MLKPWDHTPPARKSPSMVLPLFGVLGLVFVGLAMLSPHETAEAHAARCSTSAAYAGLKNVDGDHLPAWYSRAQFDRLPNGYSTLPDGEGITVHDGCAFVTPTNLPADPSTAN